jgi:hypothetical protein
MLSDLSIHIPPLVAIAGYVAYPTQFRINPSLLYIFSLIHNGALIAFSAWTFISLSQILYTDGLVFQPNYYFQNPQFDRVIYWFYLSKYYEFFDTFLLYLQGRYGLDTEHREFVRSHDNVFILLRLLVENQSSAIYQKIHNNTTVGSIIFYNGDIKCVIHAG